MRQHNRRFFFPTTTPPSPATFFPSLPSPTIPTFPANLSSVLSSQPTHHFKPHFPKILLFLSPFPSLLLLLVAIVFVFLFRKWTRPKARNPSGTPREVAERDSPCWKLASPELRPLPPLVERVDGSSHLESGEVSVRVGEECRSGSGRLPVESVKIGNVGPDTLPRAPHRSRVGGSSSVVEDCGGNSSNGPPPWAPPRSRVTGGSSFVEECGESLSNGPPPWVGGGSSVEDCGGESLGFGPPPPLDFEYLSGRSSVMAVGRVPGLVAPGLDEGKNVELSRNSDGTGMCGERTPLPKLKPLHWDKIQASSNRAMVWDQLRSSSFQLNEEMIEALFMSNATNPARNESGGTQVIPSMNQENRVLDQKKSQNIAHLLQALNVTKEEVCEALLEGNSDNLSTELLETLLKMAPSKDEEVKLKGYKDDSPFKLSPPKAFLKAVLDIPFAFKRVEAMLYISNFDSEVNYLTKSFETLEAACEELRGSRMFMKLLEAVLEIGNGMNVGVNRGDAHAFKLDALLNLVDVKGTDGKTTLLHFVVQEIIRAEGSKLSTNQTLSNEKTQTCSLRDDVELKKLGLKVVAGLSGDLSNVKKAAAMDVNVLSSNIWKLSSGIGKIIDLLRVSSETRFHEAMTGFLRRAENEIKRIQAQESVAFSLIKEITEYFHGNSTQQEAHPFRIFIVVRDFLSTLDQVCKEVGKINERSSMSCDR